MEGRDGVGGTELVHEAKTDAQRDDRADDRRVGRIPCESRDSRRREQQQEQGIAQLARQDRDGRYAADGERVRAECAQACLGSVSFGTIPVRLGGGAFFGKDYSGYAVSLVAGKDNAAFRRRARASDALRPASALARSSSTTSLGSAAALETSSGG